MGWVWGGFRWFKVGLGWVLRWFRVGSVVKSHQTPKQVGLGISLRFVKGCNLRLLFKAVQGRIAAQ